MSGTLIEWVPSWDKGTDALLSHVSQSLVLGNWRATWGSGCGCGYRGRRAPLSQATLKRNGGGGCELVSHWELVFSVWIKMKEMRIDKEQAGWLRRTSVERDTGQTIHCLLLPTKLSSCFVYKCRQCQHSPR